MLTALIESPSLGDLAALVLLLGAAVVLLRGRYVQGTVADLRTALEAKEERLKEREAELVGACARADAEHERADRAESEAAACQARYEELRRFAAPEAFERLLDRISSLETATAEGFRNHGELILKNTELLATVTSAVEHLASLVDGRSSSPRRGALPPDSGGP